MPRQVRSPEELRRVSEDADEIRVVRRGESVKVKSRTRKMLYTFVTDEKEAESILKDLKPEKVEL